MPIQIPNDLPAAEILQQENIYFQMYKMKIPLYILTDVL